jgi:hypothetical protein
MRFLCGLLVASPASALLLGFRGQTPSRATIALVADYTEYAVGASCKLIDEKNTETIATPFKLGDRHSPHPPELLTLSRFS